MKSSLAFDRTIIAFVADTSNSSKLIDLISVSCASIRLQKAWCHKCQSDEKENNPETVNPGLQTINIESEYLYHKSYF